VSLGAGFVRGFAGFGYSALAVPGLSLPAGPFFTAIDAARLLELMRGYRALDD
jgi:hypothetical protein